MTNEEFEQLLLKLDKKLDKTLNLLTKIAKTLHLLPVTEAEERKIQITQRSNLATAAKINDELNDMQNKTDAESEQLTLSAILERAAQDDNIYEGIIDHDFLGGDR